MNWETKIVGWQIYLLKKRQMEKQPDKNELHSKRGMSAWKHSNTLKTEQKQLQQGDPKNNGTGKKEKRSQNVFKSRCESYFGELWNLFFQQPIQEVSVSNKSEWPKYINHFVSLVNKRTDKYHIDFLLEGREIGYVLSGLTTDTKNVQHVESKTKKVNCVKKDKTKRLNLKQRGHSTMY